MAHLNDDPWQDPAAALEAAAGQLRMIEAGGLWGPEAPAGFDDVGIERDLLADLVLKMANMVPHFTTDWAIAWLGLPRSISHGLTGSKRKADHIRGHVNPLSYRFGVTKAGHSRGDRLLEISSYVGPAPAHSKPTPRCSTGSSLDFRSHPRGRHRGDPRAGSTRRNCRGGRAGDLFPAGACLPTGRRATARRAWWRMLHGALKGSLWIPTASGSAATGSRRIRPRVP